MKFFIVFALFALAAAKPSPRLNQAQIEKILDVINRPTTNLATATALKEMLLQGLALIRPIQMGPEIDDFPVPESAVTPTPITSPLVQIIVNVKKPEDFVAGSPVVVEGMDKPEPIDDPTPVDVAEHNPVVIEPVIVADNLPPLMPPHIAVGPEILN